MSQAVPATSPPLSTVADLLAFVDGFPAERIRLRPTPGSATEQDVLDVHAREKRLCELVDGVLVEKTVGAYESYLAFVLGGLIASFVRERDLGIGLGADGMMRFAPGMVRIPDVAFIAWDRMPAEGLQQSAIAPIVPNLAVEVLSAGNTKREMDRKLGEYFAAGVQLVWYVDPKVKQIRVYTSVDECITVAENETLNGGDVLPGFTLSLAEYFAPPAPKKSS